MDSASLSIKSAKQVQPGLKFTMSFMHESVTDPGSALAWLSHSLLLTKRYPLDSYVITNCYRQIKKDLGLTYGQTYQKITVMTSRILNIVGEPEKILMKVQVKDRDTLEHIPLSEIEKILDRINSQGHVGYIFVRYHESNSVSVIKRFRSSTWYEHTK